MLAIYTGYYKVISSYFLVKHLVWDLIETKLDITYYTAEI